MVLAANRTPNTTTVTNTMFTVVVKTTEENAAQPRNRNVQHVTNPGPVFDDTTSHCPRISRIQGTAQPRENRLFSRTAH